MAAESPRDTDTPPEPWETVPINYSRITSWFRSRSKKSDAATADTVPGRIRLDDAPISVGDISGSAADREKFAPLFVDFAADNLRTPEQPGETYLMMEPELCRYPVKKRGRADTSKR